MTDTSSASIGRACGMSIPLPSSGTRGVLGDFEHLSAATFHCILCRAVPRFSPRCFSRLPPSPAWHISEHRCSHRVCYSRRPRVTDSSTSMETAGQERRFGSCGREGHRRSLPGEPRISQDTARHTGRDSLLFVNCWKLVVWIWRNKLGRNQAWHLPNFTTSHLHVTPNVL